MLLRYGTNIGTRRHRLAVTIDGLQKGGFVAGWNVGDVWPFMALLFVPALLYTQRRYDRGE